MLTVAGVAPDGGELSLEGRTVIVPDHARALVRAQVIARGARGARPTDAFFASHRQPDQPAGVSALSTMLKHVSEQTGLAMPDADATCSIATASHAANAEQLPAVGQTLRRVDGHSSMPLRCRINAR